MLGVRRQGGGKLRLEFEAKAPELARDRKGWQSSIASAAQAAMIEQDFEMTEGASRVHALFVLPRPKGLKKGQTQHVTKPDVYTLALAVRDGLKGIVIKEDAQVTDLWIDKVYARDGMLPHVNVTVGGL